MATEPAVKEPKPRKKKPVQLDALEKGGKGVGMPKLPNVERYAVQVGDLTDELKEIKEKLEDSQANLMEEMRKADITSYRFRESEVTYKPGKASVKVKHLKRPDLVPDEKD